MSKPLGARGLACLRQEFWHALVQRFKPLALLFADRTDAVDARGCSIDQPGRGFCGQGLGLDRGQAVPALNIAKDLRGLSWVAYKCPNTKAAREKLDHDMTPYEPCRPGYRNCPDLFAHRNPVLFGSGPARARTR